MRLASILALVLGALLLGSGCGSSTDVTVNLDPSVWSTPGGVRYEIGPVQAGDTRAPDHFLAAVTSYLKVALDEKGILAGPEDASHQIEIRFVRYRMRSGFSKRTFGIFAGKDGTTSLVRVIDVAGRQSMGESRVETYNLTESVTMDDMARMHAKEIARFLAGER